MFKQLARKNTLETHLCAQSLFQNDIISVIHHYYIVKNKLYKNIYVYERCILPLHSSELVLWLTARWLAGSRKIWTPYFQILAKSLLIMRV